MLYFAGLHVSLERTFICIDEGGMFRKTILTQIGTGVAPPARSTLCPARRQLPRKLIAVSIRARESRPANGTRWLRGSVRGMGRMVSMCHAGLSRS